MSLRYAPSYFVINNVFFQKILGNVLYTQNSNIFSLPHNIQTMKRLIYALTVDIIT